MKKSWIIILFFILSFYCFGAGMMDSFAMYHSWLFVGENEFSEMHQAVGKRIILIVVLPMLVLTALCVLLLWHRPSAVSKRSVIAALLTLLAGWASSAFIQIPMQVELDKGKNAALLEQLIHSDWIRVVAWLIYITIVLFMIIRLQQHYVRMARHVS